MTAAPYPDYDDTAHCRLPGVDPERFHPPKGVDSRTHATTKKLCTGGGKVPPCPFLAECREYGITHSVSGVWGGIGDYERKQIRKERRIVPEPLSMGVIALVSGSREVRATDWYTRRPCTSCGKEIRTRNMSRHLREQHGRMAS